MTFDEYQNHAQETAIYPSEFALTYLALGLASEAGEVAGIVKKIIRDQTDPEEAADKLQAELGDVLWYVSQLCTKLGASLESIAMANVVKLQDRMNRGVIGGSGDNR